MSSASSARRPLSPSVASCCARRARHAQMRASGAGPIDVRSREPCAASDFPGSRPEASCEADRATRRHVAPLLAAIRHARTSVDVMLFRFDRADLRQALADAVGRGVAVRTLIAHTNSEGSRRLRKLELDLLAAGITVARTADDLRPLSRQVLRSRPRPGLYPRVQLHRPRHQQEPELRDRGANAPNRPGAAGALRGRRGDASRTSRAPPICSSAR